MKISPHVRLYNEDDLKKQFLEQYPESTQYSYAFVFDKSFPMEERLEKDLYNFTTQEVIQVLKGAAYSTKNSVELAYRVIDYYLDFATGKGKVNSQLKVTNNITNDMLDEFINTSTKTLWSHKEVEEIVHDLVNAQDAAMVLGFYEGISGTDLGYSELLNLRKQDIDYENNELTLHNEKTGEIRTLNVSDELIRLLRSASIETEYRGKNGTGKGVRAESELIESDYVFRNVFAGSIGSKNSTEPSKQALVTRRFASIMSVFNLDNFNAKNVRNSGMLKMAKDLYKRDGELTTKQFEEIAQQYGIQKVKMGNSMVYAFTLLKKFITIDNIMKYYPEEF